MQILQRKIYEHIQVHTYTYMYHTCIHTYGHTNTSMSVHIIMLSKIYIVATMQFTLSSKPTYSCSYVLTCKTSYVTIVGWRLFDR